MMVAAGFRTPLRIIHSRSDYRLTERKLAPHRLLYATMSKSLIKRSANVKLAVSGGAAASLFGDSWGTDPRVRVIHSGIDFAPFGAVYDAAGWRRSLGLPPDALVLGHVGRFEPAKNHEFLLRIAAAAMSRDQRVRLLLVGDGPLRLAIARQAQGLGIADRVIFAGDRDEVPALMVATMDVFLLPSLREGLPRVLLEAQAAALPSMVSDRVTEEANVIPELIHRVSLTLAPESWASMILDGAHRRSVGRSEAYERMMRTDFNIEVATKALVGIYDGQLPPHAAAGQ